MKNFQFSIFPKKPSLRAIGNFQKLIKAKSYKLKAGFTLIEVLVSLTILGTAIAGAFFVVSQNIKTSSALRNNMLAAHLVQEGVEVVRNLRDRDWLAGREFGSFGRDVPVGDGSSWEVQWDSNDVGVSANGYLKIDPSTGLFSYDSGNASPFKRVIVLKYGFDPSKERVATVTVSWTDRGISRSISAEEHLYNWR